MLKVGYFLAIRVVQVESDPAVPRHVLNRPNLVSTGAPDLLIADGTCRMSACAWLVKSPDDFVFTALPTHRDTPFLLSWPTVALNVHVIKYIHVDE